MISKSYNLELQYTYQSLGSNKGGWVRVYWGPLSDVIALQVHFDKLMNYKQLLDKVESNIFILDETASK